MPDHYFNNRKTFFYFVNVCNEKYRSGHDRDLYIEIIKKHARHNNNIEYFLNDDEVYPLIINTLRAWNMDQRGAKLTSVDKFKRSVSRVKENLISLGNYKLYSTNEEEIEDEIIGLLKNVFANLNVMESRSRLVGVSKALHFLLPNLLMPIDNKFTMNFFRLSSNIDKEWERFETILWNIYDITSYLCLIQNDVDEIGWNTSVPKLIDNAIIGFYKERDEYIKNFGDDAVEKFICEIKRIESEKE